MYKLDDSGATTGQGLRAAPLALLLATTLITGCHSMSGSNGTDTPTQTNAAACVPMVPTSRYAVYWSQNKVEAVEEIPTGLTRCVVAVSQPPSAPASQPAMPTPSCSNGQVPSPAAAYYVDYYKGQPTVPLQIEDLRGIPGRCITPIPDNAGANACPPPVGRHTVLINGVIYCVPN